MRKKFFELLLKELEKKQDIVFLAGDLGFSLVEPIYQNYPNNFYNMQAAEFNMVGTAIGMSYEEKIPLCYSITPFVLYRPFELLRTYINQEKSKIRLIGVGRDDDYRSEGISHWAHDAKRILNELPNIQQFWPKDEKELVDIMPNFLYGEGPTFLSLKK